VDARKITKIKDFLFFGILDKLLYGLIAFFLQICNPGGIGNTSKPITTTDGFASSETVGAIWWYRSNQQNLVQHLFGDASLS